MRFPRRVTYCLLGAVVLVTILFRYPLGSGHEMGSDTTFIHSLTDSLIARASAVWILNPLSYFGLYALSYPSAMPFILGSVSLTGGIPVEGSILLTGGVFSIVGALSAFAASRAARDDDRLALIVALLFSIGPFYVKDTTWVGSSRGFVTALVPVVFLLLLRHLRTRDVRYLAICIMLVAMMGTIHRMGMLALLVLVAYGFAVPIHRLTQRLRFVLVRYESPFRYVSTAASITGFLALFYLQVLLPDIAGSDIVSQYRQGALFEGTSFPILVTNMMVSLVGKVGILMPLMVVGLVRLAWDRPKEDRDKFLLITVLVMIPLLSLRDYISEFMTYVFVVLIALALISRGYRVGPAYRVNRRKAAAAGLVVALLGASIGFSLVMKNYWSERYYTDGPIPNELYGTSVYILRQAGGTVLSNEGLSQGRIAAITGLPALPIGGASIHWYSPQQLTFGFVDGGLVTVRQISLWSISFQTDTIFEPTNVPIAKDDYESIFYNHFGAFPADRVLQRYDVHFMFVEKAHESEFQSYIWRGSPFIVEAQEQTYKAFDSSSYSLWYLG